jgi:hypothetical protein
MTVPPEILEDLAVEEISKATRLLLLTDWSEAVEATARKLLAEMQAQKARRGATFGAVVDEFETTIEEWVTAIPGCD